MATQSKLENIGISKRNALVGKTNGTIVDKGYSAQNPYYEEDKSDHKDVLSDGDIMGKGAQHPGPGYVTPSGEVTITQDGLVIAPGLGYGIITNETEGNTIGGSRDRQERMDQMRINRYSANHPYGEDSIDTMKNVSEGQYVVQ